MNVRAERTLGWHVGSMSAVVFGVGRLVSDHMGVRPAKFDGGRADCAKCTQLSPWSSLLHGPRFDGAHGEDSAGPGRLEARLS